jgi:hypothetical protein
MKFDMGRAWNEATALVGANKELLAALAGIFVFLPNLALALLVPEMMTGPANVDPENPAAAMQAFYTENGVWFGLLAIVQWAGTLCMFALLNDRRPTVGEAMRAGLIALIPYLASQVIVMLALAIVLGLPVGLAFGAGSVAVGVLIALVAVVAFIYVMVKLSLVGPEMVIGGNLNPITALRNSWVLTKGNSLRLFAFYLLLGIGVAVVAMVIGLVSGLFVAMLGQNAAGLLVGGLLNGLLAAIWTVLMVCVLAAAYKQLAGPSTAAYESTFE